MNDYVAELRDTIEVAGRRLSSITEAESALRPAPGKWSRKEIVGHLIDSAANNHQRFVRASFVEDLVFPGYDQDEWVRVQGCQDAPWRELLDLWKSYNEHIARVMETIPAEVRLRPRTRHNLHEIAWKPVPASEPATLDDLMRDYVGHLKHHLDQAFAMR
jgi:hypothetical protein